MRILKRHYGILSSLLLPAAKEQLRVEFSRDDDFIRTVLDRAIGEIENAVNFDIVETETAFMISESAPCYIVDRVPILRVEICDQGTCTDLPDDNIHGGNLANPTPAKLNLSGFTFDKLIVHSGYRDPATIPPALLSAILMQVGHLYENRESVQMGNYNLLPDTTQRLLSGLWRPSV